MVHTLFTHALKISLGPLLRTSTAHAEVEAPPHTPKKPETIYDLPRSHVQEVLMDVAMDLVHGFHAGGGTEELECYIMAHYEKHAPPSPPLTPGTEKCPIKLSPAGKTMRLINAAKDI